ncbi:MAG TPA: hypothetical protein VGO48_05230 [Conexibacter sp.]|jgi:hypothetical protein|nr:hypothetical protein [Conexibacter sp.]
MRGSSPTRRALLACVAALGLLAASGVGAQASTVSLRCAGRGARNRDSAGTVLCAGSTKGRTLAGIVKDDAGKPVAARLSVTYSSWDPSPGGGYAIRARATQVIAAKGDGTFTVKDNPATKESIRVDVVADAALGVSGGAFAQAEISRQLIVRIAKLGGGVVRFTVTGTRHRPLKVYVLDESGYPLSGIKPKNVDGRGQATFNLSNVRGLRLTYYVDAGDVLGDLFWYQSRVPFKV